MIEDLPYNCRHFSFSIKNCVVLHSRQSTNEKVKKGSAWTSPGTAEITSTESLNNKLYYLVTSQQNWYLRTFYTIKSPNIYE